MKDNICNIDIRNEDTSLNIIYYQGFWYSYYAFSSHMSWSPEYVKKEVKKHSNNIKILSIFFNSIYIPRSHILTPVSIDHAEICYNFVNSDLYDIFSKNSIIQLSIRPGLDRLSDTERIYSRIKNMNWTKIIINEKEAKNLLKNTESRVIDSGVWSKNSGINTYKFLKALEEHPSINVGSLFTDSYKKSYSYDVPFLHENFMSEIFNWNIDYTLKKRVWEVTNDIYVTIPENEIKGFITYDPKNRKVSQRMLSQKYNLDMRFYSPEFLARVMEYFLGTERVIDMMRRDPLFFVNSRDILGWVDFRNKYHNIVCNITNELLKLESLYPNEVISEEHMIKIMDDYIKSQARNSVISFLYDRMSSNLTNIWSVLKITPPSMLTNVSNSSLNFILHMIKEYIINRIIYNLSCPEMWKYFSELMKYIDKGEFYRK